MDNENQRELDVLAALEGIHRMQESIRDTELDIVVETGIIFLRLHYQRLPPGVARRLTEISPRDVAEVSEVIRENGATPEQRRSLGDRLASDAAVALAVNEIVRSRRFLGENTSKEDREELLKLTTSELTSTAQVLASAVHLRQQVETAEFTRALIEQQKAAQQPPGGPLAC